MGCVFVCFLVQCEVRLGVWVVCQISTEGHSVNVPKNKMAYEVIMVYHLRMPFFIAIFLCFLKKTIRQDMALRKKSDDLF